MDNIKNRRLEKIPAELIARRTTEFTGTLYFFKKYVNVENIREKWKEGLDNGYSQIKQPTILPVYYRNQHL